MSPVYQRQPVDSASQPPASSPAIRVSHFAPRSRLSLLASGSLHPSRLPIESPKRLHPPSDQHKQEAEQPVQEQSVPPGDFSKISVFPPGWPKAQQPACSLIAHSLPRALQARLAVGPVDDPVEREADRVADVVMRLPDADDSILGAPLKPKQKSVTSKETGRNTMNTWRPGLPAANEVSETVHEVLQAPGQPLDTATRAFMEPRFGYDFSRVRVHADVAGAESARSVNAVAYTVGRDVVFGAGQYAPGQEAGRKLLAHELAHTIQQAGAHRGAPWKAVGRSEYDRGSDAPDGAAPPRAPIQRLTPQSSSLVLRQATQTDEMPPIGRDDPILLQKGLPSDPRSPIQRKLDEFRDSMKASYHTPADTPGGAATVAVPPPFGMGAGYEEQKTLASDPKRVKHLANIKKKNPRISHFIGRVQFARGSPEEIRAVTQALIDDKALDDEPAAGSLEQRIQRMMFDYRIGTDCAGYVQQAYLFARGVGRRTAGFKTDIGNENLGNLAHQGYTQIAPSAALPGDLVVLDPPSKDQPGHTIIVYSRREATADDKKELKEKLAAACLLTSGSSFLAAGATVYVFELDSSWGSGGDPEHGGIQRRTFWYNPSGTPKWAWTEDDPTRAITGELPYDHNLRGFYRAASGATRNSPAAAPITPPIPPG